jgi:chromosome partitioning protein
MLTIAIVNEKGGSGKTTSSVNLAAALGDAGKRVLLVDLDGQAASTRWLGVEGDPRLADALIQGGGLKPIQDVLPNVSLAPGSAKLDSVAHDLRPTQGGQLRKVLSELTRYDVALIDCPPSLGNRLIGNALMAATHALVPVETSILAMDCMKSLLETLQDVRDGLAHEIELLGVFACRFDSRTNLSRSVLKELRRVLPGKVLNTVIRENVRLRECPATGQSVLTYAPRSNGAKDYRKLAAEVVEMLEGKWHPVDVEEQPDELEFEDPTVEQDELEKLEAERGTQPPAEPLIEPDPQNVQQQDQPAGPEPVQAVEEVEITFDPPVDQAPAPAAEEADAPRRSPAEVAMSAWQQEQQEGEDSDPAEAVTVEPEPTASAEQQQESDEELTWQFDADEKQESAAPAEQASVAEPPDDGQDELTFDTASEENGSGDALELEFEEPEDKPAAPPAPPVAEAAAPPPVPEQELTLDQPDQPAGEAPPLPGEQPQDVQESEAPAAEQESAVEMEEELSFDDADDSAAVEDSADQDPVADQQPVATVSPKDITWPTPESEYYRPILEALAFLGGSGKEEHVLEQVEEIMSDKLNDLDRKPPKDGSSKQPVWQLTVQKAKRLLSIDGLVKEQKFRKVWKITPRGKAAVANSTSEHIYD